jgi:tRNA(adenine34) deaminase
VNALLQVSAHDHSNISGCTLYTTMEPCPLCVGALVMSNVRNLCFAARDGMAGSVNLLHSTEFMSNKQINVSGPNKQLEVPSVVLHTYFLLRIGRERNDKIIQLFKRDCPEGVCIAIRWFEERRLEDAKRLNRDIGSVLDEIDQSEND